MELEALIEKFRNQKDDSTPSYEEPSTNMFDAPIPGQSLTDEPGNYHGSIHPQTRQLKKLPMQFMKVLWIKRTWLECLLF